MARARHFDEYEERLISVCAARGVSSAAIARKLGRSRQGVNQKLAQMRKRGLMDQLEFDATAELLVEAVKNGR